MIHDLILRQVEKDLLELKVQVRKELERLSSELMQENPVGRMSLEEAAESFEKMEEEGNNCVLKVKWWLGWVLDKEGIYWWVL